MTTAFLKAGGRSVTLDRISREYRVEDAADESDVLTFVGSLPDSIGGLPFVDFSATELEEQDNAFDLTVNWGSSNNNSSQEHNTVEYQFNFQAPSAHIYQSLETISNAYDTAVYPSGPPNFHGAINVVYDGIAKRVEGVQLPVPAEIFKLSYVTNNDVISGSYQLLVESLCGKVNSSSFRGRPAGSIMLVRVNGGRNRSGVWSIDFGFAYVANATSIAVGPLTVAAKDGFDLLWTLYGADKDTDAKQIIKRPVAAYVERVYERADLNQLGLP